MISVVIPTYNRLDTLKHVLEAFNHQTLSLSEFEVILVDSMSDDGTEEFVKNFKAKYPFRYLRQENRGRSGARNRGILEAKGEIVLFIDSDIIPDPSFLEAHIKFHATHARCAAVGWESRIDSVIDLPEAKQDSEHRFRIHPPKPKRLSWLYFLTGNASVAREDLIRAGLFDEAFQGYGYEDLELGYRLEKAGIQIHYLPSAINYHVHPRTFENQARVFELAGQNAVRFYRKHKDWKIRWLLGMSPLALFWYQITKHLPWIQRFLPSSALLQYHYLRGVSSVWGHPWDSPGTVPESMKTPPDNAFHQSWDTPGTVPGLSQGCPKIAVVRLDKIGDFILTTPAIASIKRAFPNSRITAITSAYNKPAAELCPEVDEVWDWTRSFKNLMRLRNAKFDSVIVFSPTSPSYLLAGLSGALTRVGYVYASRPFARLLAFACLSRRIICRIDQKDIGHRRTEIPHEVEQNLDLVRSLGVQSNLLSRKLSIQISKDDRDWGEHAIGTNRPIALHLSEAWKIDLPPDFLHRLLFELGKNYETIVTCGPAESLNALALPKSTRTFSGLSFSRWAALMQTAGTLVSTNTGAIHLAASQGVPVVAVFEPQFFAYHEKRWAPWKVPFVILRKDDPNLLDKIVEGVRHLAVRKENIGSNLQL